MMKRIGRQTRNEHRLAGCVTLGIKEIIAEWKDREILIHLEAEHRIIGALMWKAPRKKQISSEKAHC